MKVAIRTVSEVEPAKMKINLKLRDEFRFELFDDTGTKICGQDEGYVPGFVPGQYGDYLDLEIDVRTGQILNWLDGRTFTHRLQTWIDDNVD